MIDPALLHVLVLHAVVVVSPGPNFVIVGHTATTSSRSTALWTAGGVTAGAIVWASAATLGFAAFVHAAGEAYSAVRIAGATYLLWLGIKLWRGAAGGHVAPVTPRAGAVHAFVRGLLTNLANPKSIVFFASVLSVALPRDATAELRVAAVVVVGVNAAVWYSFVAVILGREQLRSRYLRHRRLIDRIAALLMIVLALRLLLG